MQATHPTSRSPTKTARFSAPCQSGSCIGATPRKWKRRTGRPSVSEVQPPPQRSGLWLIGVLAVVGIAGVFLGHTLPPGQDQSSTASTRPVVQITRQPGLSSLSDAVSRLCPAMAKIVPAAQTGAASANGLPAFAVSADGWLVASAPLPQNVKLQALFGDGQQSPIDEVRTD